MTMFTKMKAVPNTPDQEAAAATPASERKLTRAEKRSAKAQANLLRELARVQEKAAKAAEPADVPKASKLRHKADRANAQRAARKAFFRAAYREAYRASYRMSTKPPAAQAPAGEDAAA